MATPPDLLRLPPELMLRISTYLTTIELGSFRLTCKDVERNLFKSFALEFFTKRQFMITQFSLDALAGIANHPTLAPYLNEVIIGLDAIHDRDSIVYDDDKNISRDVFLATGGACDLLVDAFSKLPNLRSVGLRDYHGNGRFRDGEYAKWRSYGWSCGTPFRERFAPPDDMLPLLLFTLGKASVRPTNFEAFLRRKRIPDRSFDITPLRSDVASVLSGLRTLLLNLDDVRPLNAPQGPRFNGHHHLQRFLQHTPLLEHLRLNFANRVADTSNDIGSESLLRWFGTPTGVAVTTGSSPIALDHLTTLDLGLLYVTPKTLLQVVSKCAKLKALSLWKVTLQSLDNRGENTDCLWSSCLPKIGKAFQAPEDVCTITIGFAYEQTNHFSHPEVKFASQVSVDGNGEKKFEDPEGKASYRKRVGSNVKEWLEDLGKRTFVEKPDLSDDRDDSEDDEDDEGEDVDVEDDDGEHAEDDDSELGENGGGEAQVIVLD
ncbi:hypothetical protein MBLNU13_g01714t1 [Cladosporium sp. NU13]